MNILITGCAGLLGSHLTRHFLRKGYNVIGIDNLSGGYKDFLPKNKNFTFHKIDLANADAVQQVFSTHKFAAVYHFAAYAAEGLSPFIRRFNYQNNVINSINIINECVTHDTKIIFTSSMAVYGCSVPPFSEELTPTPCDPYGIAKYAVELDLKQAHSQFGLSYSIVRPHNVVGIYQNIWDNYRNVIGIFIRQCLSGEPISIYGDGEQTRAFSDIKYYMTPSEALINYHNRETFNIGANKVYSLNEIGALVESIGEHKGYPTEIVHLEGRHEVKHAFSDHGKAEKHLDFKDNTNIEETISEMFDWAIKQPSRPLKKNELRNHKRYVRVLEINTLWI